MKNATKILNSLLLSTALLVAMPMVVAAQNPEGSPLVGSWEVFDDNSPVEFLATFNGSPTAGTVNITAGSNLTSLAHGAWEKTGPRTYSSTDKAFIFDASGAVVLKQKINAEIEVSGDGNSLTAALDIDIIDPGSGMVIQSISTTATGTRITVE